MNVKDHPILKFWKKNKKQKKKQTNKHCKYNFPSLHFTRAQKSNHIKKKKNFIKTPCILVKKKVVKKKTDVCFLRSMVSFCVVKEPVCGGKGKENQKKTVEICTKLWQHKPRQLHYSKQFLKKKKVKGPCTSFLLECVCASQTHPFDKMKCILFFFSFFSFFPPPFPPPL